MGSAKRRAVLEGSQGRPPGSWNRGWVCSEEELPSPLPPRPRSVPILTIFKGQRPPSTTTFFFFTFLFGLSFYKFYKSTVPFIRSTQRKPISQLDNLTLHNALTIVEASCDLCTRVCHISYCILCVFGTVPSKDPRRVRHSSCAYLYSMLNRVWTLSYSRSKPFSDILHV